MKNICICVMLLLSGMYAHTQEERPKFDKKDYCKTVWSHVNPWFPMNKQRIHDLGGPDYAMKEYPNGVDGWCEGIKTAVKYGITGWQVEVNEPGAWIGTYKDILTAAEKSKTGLKVAMFNGFFSGNPQKSVAAMGNVLRELKDILKNHPNVYRINGSPVMIIYNPATYQADEWKFIISSLEKEFGHFVWLACLTAKHKHLLSVFDGITKYGASIYALQEKDTHIFTSLMQKQYPEKIYETTASSTYLNHFHTGGVDVRLSENFRKSFALALQPNPDSITITNWFDNYENTHILPSYEREDLLLRYAQHEICKWRGTEFPKEKHPELVLTNYNMVLLGWQNLDFEILGFPIDAKNQEVTVAIELCNTKGEVLRRLPERKMTLSGNVKVETFSVPSTDFAKERGIVPRLTYLWQGKEYKMNYNPMTLISPSIRSYRMYWARSTRNALEVNAKAPIWMLGGKTAGETLLYPESGVSNFSSWITPTWGQNKTTGYVMHSIKRNGMEFYNGYDFRNTLNVNLALNLPKPNGALNYYHIEMENKNGHRYRTLPVWVANNSRPGTVKLPVKEGDTVKEYEMEAARVPYFYYPCSEDSGSLLLDASGYMHNGNINGKKYGGGHLNYTGYYHYNNGPVVQKEGSSIFARDENGRGMLSFKGKDFVTFMGGTAFPAAMTYEMSVRPAKIGKLMGLLGSANNSINLAILPDGRLKVSRGTETEGMGGQIPKKRVTQEILSKTKLEAGKWVRIAIVYDLKKLSLYLDGKFEGEVTAQPMKGQEWINHLLVGALNKWVWEPIEHFTGDIREIRFYGRNLKPEEFLSDTPRHSVLTDPYQQKTKTDVLMNESSKQPGKILKGTSSIWQKDGLSFQKTESLQSTKVWEIDPSAEYTISFRAKNHGKPFSLYFGFSTWGVASREVHFISGTETELLKDVAKGDSILLVKDASAWKTGNHYVAFRTDKTGYRKDLPNKNLAEIKKIAQKEHGWEIELKKPVSITAKAGEGIREHCDGLSYNFIGVKWMDKKDWVDVSAKVKGISAGSTEEGKFWPGARKIQLIICPVGKLEPGQFVVDDIKLTQKTVLSD